MNIMNKLLLVIGAASMAIFLPNASALTMQTTLGYGSRHSGNGGEFNASSADFAPATMGYAAAATFSGGFETFCVEKNEYFNPGATLYYGISQAAINGGISGGNPDPISKGTAWLYLGFAQGTLAGYNYTVGTLGNASAAALQATIWWLEGEQSDPGAGNTFRNAVIALPNYLQDNNGYYGVGVLNLWDDRSHTKLAQDQLILVSVPDGGATAMLLGLGLLGLFLVNRNVSRERAAKM